MQQVLELSALFVFSYLLGSIPTAYLVGKLQGIDIRERGSGNVGTMNAGAVMGWRFAFPVFLVDCLKGFIASVAGRWMGFDLYTTGFFAVVGHVYPVWLRGRGGKGLATALGCILAAGQWLPVAIFGAGWWLTFPFFRQVDRATLIGTLALLVYAIITGPNYGLALIAVLLSFKHAWVIIRDNNLEEKQ
ncbi:MAG: glycerol-3-phosphate acyltransferase [Chitinophagales bacterium]